MSKAPRVECPMCGRLVAFVEGATNTMGAPIMERHWRADVLHWQWCKASRNSLAIAALKRDLEGWRASKT